MGLRGEIGEVTNPISVYSQSSPPPCSQFGSLPRSQFSKAVTVVSTRV